VVNLVSFHGGPAPIPDFEIASLQEALRTGRKAESYPYLQAGQQVEIAHGSLQGLRGRVLRSKNGFRVVLSVELLKRSIVVDVDAADLSKWSASFPRH
jgi:transcription antitermination factor NusG